MRWGDGWNAFGGEMEREGGLDAFEGGEMVWNEFDGNRTVGNAFEGRRAAGDAL